MDPVSNNAARDTKVKEALIKVETLKILRERLGDCYKREGVNHYERCQVPAKAYIDIMFDMRFGKAGAGL